MLNFADPDDRTGADDEYTYNKGEKMVMTSKKRTASVSLPPPIHSDSPSHGL